MSLIRQRNLERRQQCVEAQRGQGRTGNALSARSLEFLAAAEELERATGDRGDALADGGAETAIEEMGPALDAIANANLMLSLLVRELATPEPRGRSQDEIANPPEPPGEDAVERATRLLFGASQNLRIAAEASKLAAAAVDSMSLSSE